MLHTSWDREGYLGWRIDFFLFMNVQTETATLAPDPMKQRSINKTKEAGRNPGFFCFNISSALVR
jgi:hypothetical protein